MTTLINPDFFPQDKAHFMLQGPAGLLEVMTTTPTKDSNLGVGIVCHPHPLQEGAMTNKVVHTVAKAFDNKGLKTVRFNFRGVGQSKGTFADAIGETDDLMAVINWVNKVCGPKHLLLAGFSFGAYVAAAGASKSNPDQLITIAPGVKNYPFDKIKQVLCPWMMIQGIQDEIVDVEDVKSWVHDTTQTVDLHLMDETSHFFHGKLIDLRNLIEEHLIELS